MAYITKEEVKAKSIKLKEINKKYGIKATFSGSNSSTLTLTISSGKIDFIANYSWHVQSVYGVPSACVAGVIKSKHLQVNHYHLNRSFSFEALEYLEEVYELMKEGHYDRSDVQTDYFECSWYNSINIGRWNRGYEVTK
jgi:hypothetical protein